MENKGLKSYKLKTKEGKSLMVAVRNKDGSIATDRDKIVERCAEFYMELYSSTSERPTIQTSVEDSVPEVLITKVQNAVKHMKNNKAPRDDGIVIDVIKEGGEALYKPLSRLFTNCLRQRTTPAPGTTQLSY